MRKSTATLCALSGLWFARGAPAQAAKPPPAQDAKTAPADVARPAPGAPDLDFLEYLGAWQENDEEWLVSEQWQKDAAGRKRAADKADGKKPGQARNDGDESK
jgi:hypothetical protein